MVPIPHRGQSSGRRRLRRFCVVAAIVITGCSSDTDQLSENLVESTQAMVATRVSAASVDLGPSDAECVARRMTDDEANELARSIDEPGLSSELSMTMARGVLACVDADELIRSASAPFTAGTSEESADCVAGALNAQLTEALIAANLEGVGLPAAQVELELATALGLCLDPNELLDRG